MRIFIRCNSTEIPAFRDQTDPYTDSHHVLELAEQFHEPDHPICLCRHLSRAVFISIASLI